MRLSSILPPLGIFAAAGAVFFVAAQFSADLIEENSQLSVLREFEDYGLDWADADTNGLQVFVIGTAPTEADRFRALSLAGNVVDAARLIDQMNVAETEMIAPPRFSIEILRNDAGISLIGLIPTNSNRDALVDRLARMTREKNVSDLLETADFPTPDGWEGAMDFASIALQLLPRSKISVEAGHVVVTAMAESPKAKRSLETELLRKIPRGVELNMQISAPRPVITPFTLRVLAKEGAVSFDACSADSEAARSRIIAAAERAGLADTANCTIGLGVPTVKWSEAAVKSIDALARLGDATVTFADADVTLIASEGTEQALFDEVVGELENALPDVFALHAVLPKVETEDETGEGPPEFTATLSPEGTVQMRGRVGGGGARHTIQSFAQARFGSTTVHNAARADDTLDQGWSVRVLAGLEALSRLANGVVTVTPDTVEISGNTGRTTARADIAQVLSAKLGAAENFAIDVTYLEKLDPLLSIPTPEECQAQVTQVIAASKIAFEPGSATIDPSSAPTMDALAEVLKTCPDAPFEIGGHTDSQGREVMNQQLSQDRAQSVLDELRARRVFTSAFRAVGYGEAQPIADNQTEDGREANRRIEFKLLTGETPSSENADSAAPTADAASATTDATGEGGTNDQN